MGSFPSKDSTDHRLCSNVLMEKNSHISGSVQFEPRLFKGQLIKKFLLIRNTKDVCLIISIFTILKYYYCETLLQFQSFIFRDMIHSIHSPSVKIKKSAFQM